MGAGKHGSRYAAHAARDVEGLELAAVCRRDRGQGQALADQLGCGYEADAEARGIADGSWVELASRIGSNRL